MSEEILQSAPEQERAEKTKKPVRTSRRVAIFGTFILIFAIIGIISTVITATRVTMDLVENKSQKEELKHHVFPLVILDPPAFDSIDKLDASTILEAGIWDFIMYADKAKYDKDDLGNMSVPATDIEIHITKVFGKSAVIQHQEISDSELQILYDEESKTYSIPSSANLVTYVPDIEKVEKQGDVFTVTVGYIPSTPAWQGDVNGQTYQPEPDKSLKYVLKKTGKESYIITAVQEIPIENTSDPASELYEDISSAEEIASDDISDSSASTSDASAVTSLTSTGSTASIASTASTASTSSKTTSSKK